MSRYLYPYLSIFLVLAGMWIPLQGQYTWENHGPDNIGSITRTIAFYNNGSAIMAGSQGGGLWQSFDNGDSWQPVPGYTGNPNVTSLAVDGSTLLVGTGSTKFRETFNERSLNYPSTYDYRTDRGGFFGNLQGKPGGGVYISTDNGESWSNDNGTTKAPFGAGTLQNEGPFTDIMKVAARDGNILIGTAEGLFFSNNELGTVLPVNGPDFLQDNMVFDIEFAAENRVYATVHRDNDNPTDSVFISTDNGRSWSTLTDEFLYQTGGILLANRSVRTEIAVAPSNENIVYIASCLASGEVAGVVRYDISADEWTRVSPRGGGDFNPLGGNGRDAFVLKVLPNDENALILAGNRWFTYSEAESWNQTAQHINPSTNTYIPTPIFDIAFDPNNPNAFLIGTGGQITSSQDGGETFARRSKGYESTVAMTVTSLGYRIEGEEGQDLDAIIGGTLSSGVLMNAKYNTEQANLQPAKQGFGQLSTRRYTRVAASLLAPGTLVIQGTDGGLVRSLNLGEIFETFYGLPLLPQVANLVPATSDTIIDRTDANESGGGTMLDRPTPAQSVFALDEFIPEDLASQLTNDGEEVSVDEVLEEVSSYIYFCSQHYIWVVNRPFDDLLQVRWNRISNELVDGTNEVFTAMEVAHTDDHTLYVGTSRGNIFRIDRPHDLENFDVNVNVVKLTEDFDAVGLNFMEGRWITDLAVDPNDPNTLAVTYAGYSDPAVFGWPHVTYNALDSMPTFGAIRSAALNNAPTYTAKFIDDGGNSVLLLGTELGLYSLRNLGAIVNPGLVTAEVTPELEGPIVYDIFARPYRAVVQEKALTRTIEVEVVVGDSTITETREVEVDRFQLEDDQNIYIATYGRGFWSTNSLSARLRGGEGTEDPLTQAFGTALYPNPTEGATPSLKVELPEAGQGRLRVIGLDGRIIHLQELDLQAGATQVPLKMPQALSTGIYVVEIEVQGETEQYRAQHKLLWTQE